MSEQAILLLIEDREDDIELIRRAFKRGELLNPVQVVRSGNEAIRYLSGEGRYANRAEFPLPSVVLLDLKLPGMDGFEVLGWIRKQAGFGALRVVVLTSSNRAEDVKRAYQLGANSFLVKPVEFERLVEMTAMLKGYWLWMDQAPEVWRGEGQREERR